MSDQTTELADAIRKADDFLAALGAAYQFASPLLTEALIPVLVDANELKARLYRLHQALEIERDRRG